MKITIIGTGYVGLVTGSCLARDRPRRLLSRCRSAQDRDPEQRRDADHEPGLLDIIARNRAAGRLRFSTDIEASVAHGEIQFIAVGTPPDEDGSADLQYVLAAARNIGRHMTGFKVIVDKSTVPVGTAQRVRVVDDALAARGSAAASRIASRSSPTRNS
jgi:UDPglucose 6-dehydrogenase